MCEDWGTKSQNGCVRYYNWLQTYVRYEKVMDKEKDRISNAKEDFDYAKTREAKYFVFGEITMVRETSLCQEAKLTGS